MTKIFNKLDNENNNKKTDKYLLNNKYTDLKNELNK